MFGKSLDLAVLIVGSVGDGAGAESDAESQSAVGSVSTAGDLSVSPKELRKALSSLNTAVHFNESDMHDASEVGFQTQNRELSARYCCRYQVNV